MDMMDHNGSNDKSQMCAGLDKAIDMLNSYIANPQMVNEKTLSKVIDLLQQHRDTVMGEESDSEDSTEQSMPQMLDTPYRSDNMKRPNPYAR